MDYVIIISGQAGKIPASDWPAGSDPDEIVANLLPESDIFVMIGNYPPEIRLVTHNEFNYHMVDYESI